LPCFLITFLISCNEKSTPSEHSLSQNRTCLIHLEKPLGQLKINLPTRFDTTFKWIEYSDCNGCEHVDYRIQSKSLPILKESGFYYFPLEDSVEQFTIKHQIGIDTFNNTKNDFKPLSNNPRSSLSWIYSQEQVVLDTQLLVHKRYFNIEAAKYFDSTHKVRNTTLNAVFLIKNNLLKISFEYRKSYPDSLNNNFIQEALEAIRSIEIL
jgi:hypothetical protein